MTLVNIQCWHCNREGHTDDEADDVGVDYLGSQKVIYGTCKYCGKEFGWNVDTSEGWNEEESMTEAHKLNWQMKCDRCQKRTQDGFQISRFNGGGKRVSVRQTLCKVCFHKQSISEERIKAFEAKFDHEYDDEEESK